MADPSKSNAPSFFPHSHGFSYVKSNLYNVAGNMDVHNHSDQGRGRKRSSLFSGLLSRIGEAISWSTESPVVNRCTQRIVSQSNIELLDQLSSRRQYRIHSAKYKQRLVLVKVFQGTQAKKNFKEEKRQNQRLLHPSLLKMIGVSSFTTESPFIVYNFAPTRGSPVSELAIGLDYLSSEGARAGSSSKKSIEIFITDDDVLKIAPDFGSLLVEDSGRHEESDTDPLWGLFNDLCDKTFKQATCILYPDVRNRKVSSTIAKASSATATDVLGDTESLMSDVSSNLNFSEPKGSLSPRRELLWRESSRGSRSVHAVAKHYREFWEHLNLTVGQSYHSYAMPRKQAARPLRIVVHRCQGYRKEEITLTSDVAENAIVSHFIPSLHERCPVCKEIVEEEEFGYDGTSPTVKCSACGVWQHRSCVAKGQGDAQFVCFFCPALFNTGDPYIDGPNSISSPDIFSIYDGHFPHQDPSNSQQHPPHGQHQLHPAEADQIWRGFEMTSTEQLPVRISDQMLGGNSFSQNVGQHQLHPAEADQIWRGFEITSTEQLPVWLSDQALSGNSFSQNGMDAFLLPADYLPPYPQIW
ncbi:hypothetical protein D9758_010014 [Tetrapyrgos nigripes]|uniref:Zinc finger PHD-type domain-containing protein n=1 Tax=Tetrapyrgos nigripes TaxID=182062 RepID=A0A8H5CTY0_9AGAR|nr:hypothetical protein D9758_010014 [Tetrapyrgos nigripes]